MFILKKTHERLLQESEDANDRNRELCRTLFEAQEKELQAKELINVALISKEDSLRVQELIEFCEKHYVDELSVNGITIKRTVHLLPEDPDAEKKRRQAAIDLISYSAD